MKNSLNKTHWYDGWFYDLIIAPNQDRLFFQIKEIIEPASSVIDVGCGTGRLSFFIADKVSNVVGIDLSQKNIERANKNLSKNPDKKISFVHTDISSMISKNEKFDYAVMTYVIHEVNEDERVEFLKQLSRIADKIIIGDYSVPEHPGIFSFLNVVIEFLAGSEHYNNYKSYIRNGGIKYLAEKAELRIINEIKNKPLTGHLVVLTM
ncbi:class I SAM-dependent methyltransferase [Rosettibacter firmus]|uniref:class I SAM-dependent methyltransferase n=1 Tax=Rosettibacter firmus TaxID=3111522 RepID=UPI00336BD3EE